MKIKKTKRWVERLDEKINEYWTKNFVFLSICLSICDSVSLSVYLWFGQSVSVKENISQFKEGATYIAAAVYLHLSVSLSLSVTLSVNHWILSVSICQLLSVYHTVCQSLNLCLSVSEQNSSRMDVPTWTRFSLNGCLPHWLGPYWNWLPWVKGQGYIDFMILC